MTQDFSEILYQYWGYKSFRGIQEDIIQSISSGHDTLGLMPTGGGKSITFQVPALAMEGLCIVITPLIALMKDQVHHLRQLGIPAVAVYSGVDRSKQLQYLDNCIYGGPKFLYISPERLSSEMFQQKLRRMDVCFVAVDEAHCISQWGYDFRPAYLEIQNVRKLLPNVPILALTATATPEVVEDIIHQLQFREGYGYYRMSFERKNLTYVVRRTEDKEGELLHILRSVPGSAIVYARSRQQTRDLVKLLKSEGITALYYHAGLTNTDKDVRQGMWLKEDVRVMVATNAFGMGIDKPDVRVVIHMDAPDSIESYFQEAGRAGRDGKRAYSVMLYAGHDSRKLRQRVVDTFPSIEYIRDVYEHIAYFLEIPMGGAEGRNFEFNVEKFCKVFRYFPVPVTSALQLLTRAGYIEFSEAEENISRVLFLMQRDDLYQMNYLEPAQDAVMQALLRNYTGLFSDYVYIEEERLAQATGLTSEEVYQALKQLNFERILHFIPRKNVPHIKYLRRRVEKELVVLSEMIYDKRRECMEERIRHMIEYCEDDTVCRSKYMLNYFGDTEASDCGHCDVCISPNRKQPLALKEKILNDMKDRKPRRPDEVRYVGADMESLLEAFQELVDEGKIKLCDGFFVLA